MVIYQANVQDRARRAWCCSPFTTALLAAMRNQGIGLSQIVGEIGYRSGYTQLPLSEVRAEAELMWLIQVGLLRREVDGQGITDSYRLAPLGRQLLDRTAHAHSQPTPNPHDLDAKPTLRDRVLNFFTQLNFH